MVTLIGKKVLNVTKSGFYGEEFDSYSISRRDFDRLKQARLNRDLIQSEVAELAGIARKTVLNAEKGKVQLNIMIAILMALDLTQQIDLFLPKQEISPLQLAKLQGKKRQRASGQRGKKSSHYENT